MDRTRIRRTAQSIRAGLAWWALAVGLILARSPSASAEELPEYRLKALFVYNFVLYTDWPDEVGVTINLCVYGPDPFGTEIDGLRDKVAGSRSITVWRKAVGDSLDDCQIVFIARAAIDSIPRVLEQVRGRPVLTVADSPNAASRGVALNLSVALDKITFEANLPAARGSGLNLSSKLLRLATRVIQ